MPFFRVRNFGSNKQHAYFGTNLPFNVFFFHSRQLSHRSVPRLVVHSSLGRLMLQLEQALANKSLNRSIQQQAIWTVRRISMRMLATSLRETRTLILVVFNPNSDKMRCQSIHEVSVAAHQFTNPSPPRFFLPKLHVAGLDIKFLWIRWCEENAILASVVCAGQCAVKVSVRFRRPNLWASRPGASRTWGSGDALSTRKGDSRSRGELEG